MDREILFRGKRVDNGEWLESKSIINYNSSLFSYKEAIMFGDKPMSDGTIRFVRVNPETVGQHTGLTDKNGKKIFEGDIVDFHIRGEDESYGVVKYSVEETEFYLAYDNLTLGLGRNNYSWELEVIGNIHDTPDLIKQEG